MLKNKSIKFLLIGLSLLMIGYIIIDSTSQPSTADLDGNFKEVAHYRNENNTGPILRIYAVTVQGTPWEAMEKYGNMMPYNKYGSTTVYFFNENNQAPTSLVPSKPNFDARFKPSCLASYTKDANGQVAFRKKPFQ